MRTGLIAHPPRHRAMAIVFAVVLAAAFFAFAPAVEACHSQVAITKIETGSGAPGGTYTITMTGEDLVRTVTVPAGGTVDIDQVPPGTYMLTELDGPADLTIVPNPVVVTNDDDGQTINIIVTNPFPAGKLAIEKVETGVLVGGTYIFDVVGPDDAAFSVEVTAGDTWTSDWLPLGTYTITERDGPHGHTIAPNPAVLDTDGQTVTVTAVNPYREPLGTLAIHKVETGEAAPGGTYTFDIRGPDDFVAVVEVAAGTTWMTELPFGAYYIEERGAPTGHTITPNPAIVDTEGTTVTVTATNPYRDFHGKLAITKVVTGDSAPDLAFIFDVIGPDGVAFATDPIAAGQTWTSDWLPLGSYTISERDGPSGATIAPNPVALTTDGSTVTVTATNPYRDFHGKLAITKVVTGPQMPDHTFQIDVTGPKSFSIDLAAGDTWTSDWLPLGTYTITEVDPWEGTTIVPNPAVLSRDGATVDITVTNPWPAGRMEITKVVPGATAGSGSYRLDVSGPEIFTITLAAGETWLSGWLPLGTYEITEPDGPIGHTIVPNPVVLTEDGRTVTVIVTNPTTASKVAVTLPATGSDRDGMLTLATVMLVAGVLALGSTHVVMRPQRRWAVNARRSR